MGINRPIIQDICGLIHLDPNSFEIKYQHNKNPRVYPYRRVIYISQTHNWKEIYQFAHEALHLSFFDHNNQCYTENINWVEEIVCEAFSLYCLINFAKDECRSWYGYMSPGFYIWNCGIKGPKSIHSLKHLNDELLGDKDYEILQYIHPYVLKILQMMRQSIEHLQLFLNYTRFIEDNKICPNPDIKITLILNDMQEAINCT